MVTKKASVKKTVTKKETPAKKLIENNQIRKTRASVPRPGNGGFRKNSGRKKGAATRKTRKIADELMASDEITPLEHMLSVLRETPATLKAQFDKGEIDQTEYAVKMHEMIKRKDKAACDAAPFVHPRLSSIQANITKEGQDLWSALLAEQGIV